MAEYSRIAKGSVTTTGGVIPVYLPFQPTVVQFWNQTAYSDGVADSGDVYNGYWDVIMGQGAGIYQYNNSGAISTASITSGGISTFSAGVLFQFGSQQQIIGATAANPIVFNVTAHGYMVGDVVMFEGLYESSSTGMPQICGMPFVVSAVGDANHFSVVWPGNGSNYTALSGSPSGAYVKKVLYPYLYAPGIAFIEAISFGATTTVTTTAPNNFVLGQQIGFDIPAAWGTYQLNELFNPIVPGSPVYYYVTAINSPTQFVCNAVSTGFTAFNTNQTVVSVKAGLSFPQVKAVGDVNTGGVQYSGGNLYPSPVINSVSTINGPAIQGAFVNNTRQGFSIGATLAPTASQKLYYIAMFTDYSNP